MQWENSTSAAWSGGARSVAPARKAAEAAARYWLQGAVPLWTALESDCGAARDKDVDPPMGVDGGVGLVRVAVAAHAVGPLDERLGRVVLRHGGRGLPLWVASVVVETFATDGGPGPVPPHAASPMATAMTRTASPPARRYRTVVSLRFARCLIHALPSKRQLD